MIVLEKKIHEKEFSGSKFASQTLITKIKERV
jgi:hypothetical protein